MSIAMFVIAPPFAAATAAACLGERVLRRVRRQPPPASTAPRP